jgi:hypothetical protein
MHYLEMRSEDWVIGSGMVEIGGKRFKDRSLRRPIYVGAAMALSGFCRYEQLF